MQAALRDLTASRLSLLLLAALAGFLAAKLNQPSPAIVLRQDSESGLRGPPHFKQQHAPEERQYDQQPPAPAPALPSASRTPSPTPTAAPSRSAAPAAPQPLHRGPGSLGWDCSLALAAVHREAVMTGAQTRGDYSNDAHEWYGSWARAIATGLSPAATASKPLHFIDIGANVGQTGNTMLNLFPAPTLVHSYELNPATFTLLSNAWAASPHKDRWRLTNAGAAAEPTTMPFFAGAAGDQTAGLGKLSGHSQGQPMPITTVAEILKSLKLEDSGAPQGSVFLKVDVEGWEREVLAGAALESNYRHIAGIYAEYGQTWIDSRSGPSKLTLAQVVAWLDGIGPAGYACFLAGRQDLASISPPFDLETLNVLGYGPNFLCLRRDLPIYCAVVGAHRFALPQCMEQCGVPPAA